VSDLPDIIIFGINLKRRAAVADIGLGTIKNFLDMDGDETQDASIATVAIIEWDAGGWSHAVIDEFTELPS
jgi:hypothetical protein